MKNIIKAVCVIIGTIIGAGFASGREIYLFFNIYGKKGVLGLIIASILTGIIIYKVLVQIKNMEVNHYSSYLENLKINKTIKNSMNIIINIFLLISFYIMIAGFCAYFKQEYGLSTFLVGIIVSFMCYLTFMNHIDGITKINTVLIPFLIMMILWMGIKSNVLNIEKVTSRNGSNSSKRKLVNSKLRIC